jgi:hypothetical protein
MDTKEEFISLIKTVIENSTVDGKPTINNTDIAKRLGIDRAYMSTLKGEKGKVDEVLLKAFKFEFASELSGSPNVLKKQTPSDTIFNLSEANKMLAEAQKINAQANLNYSEANKTLEYLMGHKYQLGIYTAKQLLEGQLNIRQSHWLEIKKGQRGVPKEKIATIYRNEAHH